MRLDRTEIKRILVITLNNLGDIVLTTPVVEVLLREFPDARLDVMVGPSGVEIFEKHPKISELIIYDKFQPLPEKVRLILGLRRRRYSAIVDLRNTFIPYLVGAPHKSLPFKRFTKHIVHKKDVHLWKLKTLGISINSPPYQLYIDDEDRGYIQNILKDLPYGRLVVVNASAKSHIKRWTKEGFVYVVNKLREELGVNIVMIGSQQDQGVVSSILDEVEATEGILNLVGKTTVRQLIALLERTDLLITNDSAPLHIASILGTKTLALFGPTDVKEYGPFSSSSVALQIPLICTPCRVAQCVSNHECMRLLKKEKVFEVAEAILEDREFRADMCEPKRILLVRTDRIGDVVLSTPAIKAVWDNFPNSFIAFMVQPYAKDIVEGNPYVDEVIIFDKNKDHRGIWRTLKFVWMLREKNFDMAIVLHPTNRVHIVMFLAGIHERIGYDKKMGFLLTKKIPHTKQLGQKHEMEYTLDILRSMGIESRDKKLFMPMDERTEGRIAELLSSKGVKADDVIVGIHPGASCPSKRWGVEKFAELATKIIESFNVKIIVISGPSDVGLAKKLVSHIEYKVINHVRNTTVAKEYGKISNVVNLAGALSIKELAHLLKRCALFISNDSGPVHIAVAVGTPVISIFGRNEKGLSPTRWRPLGTDDVVIHKDVGCRECLAYNCKIDFECLKRIEVKDALDAVHKFLH